MARLTLIVVDMLNDFFERNVALASQREGLVAAANSLIAAFREHDQPVIWIRDLRFCPSSTVAPKT